MQNNSTLWAQNSRGVKRQFTRIAWDLLGKNKEGWTEIAEQPITNVAAKKPIKPATGEQKVNNVAPAAAASQKVEDVTKTTGESTQGATDEQKEMFAAAAEGLNAGPIKDYFDAHEPRIEFDKKAKKPELIAKLGEVLNYDVVELQKLFN